MPAFPHTDIHCHLLPGIDDGAGSLDEALAMAEAACRDGTRTVIATPHQLGGNGHVTAAAIHDRVAEVNAAIARAGIGLTVLPGADVRIEPELPALLRRGEVLTLADRGRHVLLELPHEVCFPLVSLLAALARQGLTGILSHPERNKGMQARPETVAEVVRAGGLIQITAGSLTGGFGGTAKSMAEWCVRRRLVHFVASDAHDTRRRPCGLSAARAAVAMLAGAVLADQVVCENPALVAEGREVVAAVRSGGASRLLGWLSRRVG
jgi:protein-tyrosine phosphatase